MLVAEDTTNQSVGEKKSARLSIAVLLPTYRRPDDLERCLTALKSQTRLPDTVVVVVRDTDELTRGFLSRFESNPLTIVMADVHEIGVVAAMNRGLAFVREDLLAITDDDTSPHPDWIEKIERYFLADPELGGLGGRDWQPHERWNETEVGKIQWFGRIIGNHHLGIGPAREVDIIKGANSAYRADLVRPVGFDTRLRGSGAQAHWEMSLCLKLKRDGWKLIYDPDVAIDHFPGQRFDNDQLVRGHFEADALSNAVYNETIVLMEHLSPMRRIAFLTWSYAVGTGGNPGLIQVPRLIMQKRDAVGKRLAASWAGRTAAVRDWSRERRQAN